MSSVLETIPCALVKNVYVSILGGMSCRYLLSPSGQMCLKTTVLFWIFCLADLSTAAVAAAAKSLQLCPTLCDLIDGSPPGSPVPGILQARTVEWVAISFSNV